MPSAATEGIAQRLMANQVTVNARVDKGKSKRYVIKVDWWEGKPPKMTQEEMRKIFEADIAPILTQKKHVYDTATEIKFSIEATNTWYVNVNHKCLFIRFIRPLTVKEKELVEAKAKQKAEAAKKLAARREVENLGYQARALSNHLDHVQYEIRSRAISNDLKKLSKTRKDELKRSLSKTKELIASIEKML